MIKISIIVPFYNVEKYIEQCIHSLYDQNIPQEDYEVICVDDCGPDKSREIVQNLQKEYKTIRLVTNERNMKLGGARNSGIKAAQGKYILFVDSDDYLEANCLGRLVCEMEDSAADYILFDNSSERDGIVKYYKTSHNDTSIMSGPDLFFSSEHPWYDQIVAWNKIYRREFLLENNLFFLNDIMYEDNDYAFRVAAAAKKCKYIHYAPYVYRFNIESVSQSKMEAKKLIYWQIVWRQFFRFKKQLVKVDSRFEETINRYLKQDLIDLLGLLRQLSSEDIDKVKHAMGLLEWYQMLRLFPIRKRIEITKQICML